MVRRDVVARDPDALGKWFDRHCPDLARVVPETGTLSTFLYHGLTERDWPVECICARHAKGVLSARVCPRQHRRSGRGEADHTSGEGGAIKVFTDIMSGKSMDRPGLAELLAYARNGDTLAVVRLRRSSSDVPQLMPSNRVAHFRVEPCGGVDFRPNRHGRIAECGRKRTLS